jgi:hypothetical protein
MTYFRSDGSSSPPSTTRIPRLPAAFHTPATRALIDAGYESLDDLPTNLDVLLEIHGIGPSAVERLNVARRQT